MAGRLVIITGLSGAGRTEAMRALEDLGYFCVDNLPSGLIPKFVELFEKSPDVLGAALVLDPRSGTSGNALQTPLELDHIPMPHRILYLEADDETLIRRYKQSRRPHPMDGEGRLSLAIAAERKVLRELRERADVIVDTSDLTAAQFRHRLKETFRLDNTQDFRIRMVSFGFKFGLPKDADLVFDIRFLPNPHYIPELEPLTGNDAAVENFVLGQAPAVDTLRRFNDLLEYLMPRYQEEGKPLVTVAVGCTGGKHRSVVFANAMTAFLTGKGWTVAVEHRDLSAGVQAG